MRDQRRRLRPATLLVLGILTAAASAPATARSCEPSTVALQNPPGYSSGGVMAFGPRGVIGGTAERQVSEHRWEQAAVLWRDGEPSLVGDLPASFVADINAGGEVLVVSDSPSGRALLFSRGVARELAGLRDGDHVFARRLNDRGDVVGAVVPAEGGPDVPVLWPGGGAPVALPLPEGAEVGGALGVNEQGDVVGWVYGPGVADAYIWRANGEHGRLTPGDWGPEDPGFGYAMVVDEAGRAAGATGPLFEPGAVATIWTRSGRRAAAIPDGWAIFYGTNGQGDFVGEALDEPTRDGTPQLLLMNEDGPPLTLMPLSGDLDDDGLAHAVSTRRHGDVTVGGSSWLGGERVATLWHCAYAQAVPYDAQGARNTESPPPRGVRGARTRF